MDRFAQADTNEQYYWSLLPVYYAKETVVGVWYFHSSQTIMQLCSALKCVIFFHHREHRGTEKSFESKYTFFKTLLCASVLSVVKYNEKTTRLLLRMLFVIV